MKRFAPFFALIVAFAAHFASADASLAPFYDSVTTEEGSFFALRPFYSRTVLEEGEIQDYLWPLYSRKAFKDEKTSRALIFWFTHEFGVSEESPRDRNWLLPVYFQGRDANDEGYFAIFPLGGTIHEFMGRDTIAFALFPLWGKSQINEVKTTSVLWPIYSHTRGDGVARDRVFPLYGKSVLEGKYEKKFVLWPIWNSAEYFYEGASGSSWILFPFCGRVDTELESTLWLLPPFFRFTDGEKQDRLFCPWPIFQKVESDRHRKLYIWPLWGRTQYSGGLNHRTFFIWPIFWSSKTEDAHVVKTWRMALPFFYREREVLQEESVPDEEKTEVSSYWKIWPLMSWQREGTASRFRTLELWPLKNTAPVERNWAPLWTLYKRTNVDGERGSQLLWFLWETEKNPAEESAKWSLLKGLVSYKKKDGDGQLRLFWIPHSEE